MHTESYTHSTKNKILGLNRFNELDEMKHSRSIDFISDSDSSRYASNVITHKDVIKRNRLINTLKQLNTN